MLLEQPGHTVARFLREHDNVARFAGLLSSTAKAYLYYHPWQDFDCLVPL